MSTRADWNAREVTRKLESGHPDVLDRLRRIVASVNGEADADLEQDVFMKVLEAFRRRRDIRAPLGLMRKIARDTVIDAWRARARRPSIDPGPIPEATLQELPFPEERIDRQAELIRLREAILRLGCELRGPVYLHYVENYPIRTIVRIYGKSPSAIKMALHRGRKELRRMLAIHADRVTKKSAPDATSRPPRLLWR
jgi:RNA polymerase sigma-70 factor (ECF subfamily)